MNVERAALEQELSNFVAKELLTNQSVDDLSPHDELLDSGLVDSMGIMRLIGFIDQRFEYAVPPGDVTIDNFNTLTAICEYLEAKLRT